MLHAARNTLLVLAPLLSLLTTTAQAGDDMTVREAQKLMFPQAVAFGEVPKATVAGWIRAASAGSTEAFSVMRLSVREARDDTQRLGYLVTDAVIGKFEKIDYAVAVGADGTIRRVEILRYREDHGQEVKRRSWLDQFVDKQAASTLKLDQDIDNITGATLSCSHLTDGIRRIAKVMAAATGP